MIKDVNLNFFPRKIRVLNFKVNSTPRLLTTDSFIRAVRAHLATTEGQGLRERVNALLLAPEGRRDWPLLFYSRELLFSPRARLGWVEPDLPGG